MNINKNQYTFTLNALLKNPIQDGNYNFTSKMFVKDFNYATTSEETITIYNSTVTDINSIELINLPEQSGSEGYYFMRVPTNCVDEFMRI